MAASFVDQAARVILSATLTPSTAAGGAEGARCTGWLAPIAATTSASSTRCSSSSLALQGRDEAGSLSPGHHTAVDAGGRHDLGTQHDPWWASTLAWRIGADDDGLLGALEPADLVG